MSTLESANRVIAKVKAFRFVNDVSGPGSPDFRSPKSLLTPRDYGKILESGLTIAEELKRIKRMDKMLMANATASGELRVTSHMIPVLEDPDKALSSTYREGGDPSLRMIILECRYLASFDIPRRLVYQPHTYDTESELMVLSNCIWKYLLLVKNNPYRIFKM